MVLEFGDPCLLSAPLAASGFTTGWTLQTLYDNCAEFRAAASTKKVENIHVATLGEGQGFTSVVYKITVLFDDESDADAFAFVAKVPSVSVFKQFSAAHADPNQANQEVSDAYVRAHNSECAFYDAFRNADCLPLPRVWYTHKLDPDDLSKPGLILMEDLSSRGSVVDLLSSVTVLQVKNVAKHLARFHAYILANDVAVKDIVQPGYHYQMDQFFQDRYKQTTRELSESNPAFQPLLDKIEQFATVKYTKYAIFEHAKELGIPSVLLHGDCWGSNIVFETADGGSLSSNVVAFIDWQTSTEGNPMFDLASFLVPSADGDVRREAEQFVIQLYYDELAAQFKQAGKSVAFNVKQLQQAYKLAFIVKTMEMVQCPPTLAKRIAGIDERLKEAQVAKIELRTRLVLQDAIRFAEEVGPDFLTRNK